MSFSYFQFFSQNESNGENLLGDNIIMQRYSKMREEQNK